MKARLRNLIIVGVALAVVVAGTVVAARRGGRSSLEVPMQKLAPTTFTVKLPENGVVMRPMTATIPTLVAGNVRQIFVRAGQRVSACKLLATIDNPTLQYTAEGSR